MWYGVLNSTFPTLQQLPLPSASKRDLFRAYINHAMGINSAQLILLTKRFPTLEVRRDNQNSLDPLRAPFRFPMPSP